MQDKVISFSREKNGQKVIPVINFSKEPLKVVLRSESEKGNYTELFSGKTYVLKGNDELNLPAWGYLVLYK
jgi:hypothetical protein